MEAGTGAHVLKARREEEDEEQEGVGVEAPSPYPNVLQHREWKRQHERSALHSVKSSDIAHLVLPDPDTPMNIVGLPPVSSAGTEGSSSQECSGVAGHTSNNPLNSDALSPEEREKLIRMVIERGEMSERAEKRKRQAAEVIVDSGVPVAQPQGQSALDIYHAACDGDAKAILDNLEQGADINGLGQPNPSQYSGAQFEKRWTFYAPPLVFAAAFGRERAVAALIQWGADVSCKSSTGLVARDYAAKRGYYRIVEMLDEAAQHRAAAAPQLILIRKDRGEKRPDDADGQA